MLKKRSPTAPTRIAVFASGGGSNLQSIIEHFAIPAKHETACIALVVSNKADAGALERARTRGIPVHVAADVKDGAALLQALHAHRVELIVLAGYLKLVPENVVHEFSGRMLNVHPALLPAFGGHGMYGQRVHAAVIESGARVTGVTVHFVNEHFDQGAIAAQWPVPVMSADTPQSLAVRVLQVEHWLYPRAIEAVASGMLRLEEDGRLHGHFLEVPPESITEARFVLNHNDHPEFEPRPRALDPYSH